MAAYDQPTDMAEALMALNVQPSAMTLDYAGFRTLDSVVLARKVFGQSHVTIVTDDFHTARAVFLARHAGLNAVAFSPEKVSTRFSARTRVREMGACVKAALDLCPAYRTALPRRANTDRVGWRELILHV